MNAATTNDQAASSIAKDAEGRFVAVWMEESSTIWGRRFDADGTPLGGNFQVNTSTPLKTTYPHVASDPSGNFVVAWTSTSVTGAEVMARRFDSNGAPLGDEFQVNLFSVGFQTAGGAAMSPAGFAVSWGGAGDETVNGIFARLFDADGDPVTGDLEVQAPLTTTDPRSPDVAMNTNGDFVVGWDDGDATTFAISGRRWSVAGTPAGDAFLISQGTLDARDPRVTSDSAGNFLVAWRGTFNPPESPEGPAAAAGENTPVVHVRLFDIAGFPVSPQFAVNEFTTDNKLEARPSLTDDGSFVVAWTSGSGLAFDVKGRKTGVRRHRRSRSIRRSKWAPRPREAERQLRLRTGRNAGRAHGLGKRHRRRRSLRLRHVPTLRRTSGSRLHARRRHGPVRHDSGRTDQELHRLGRLLLRHRVRSPRETHPALGCPASGDPRTQYSAHLGAPPRRELPRRADRPPVLCVHRKPLPQQGDHRLRRRRLLPRQSSHRAQMAVFLLKSKLGSAHIPPPCTGTVFTDVPCTGDPFDPWIEELAGLEITGGCGTDIYCPANPVTRQQMAVFLLKAFEGSAYLPPACAGIFDDVPCTPGIGFSDWIEELYNRGITGGCSMAPLLYCPTDPNNRGQMAVFLVKTFGLVLYGG